MLKTRQNIFLQRGKREREREMKLTKLNYLKKGIQWVRVYLREETARRRNSTKKPAGKKHCQMPSINILNQCLEA